ncbi:TBC1 domain family member 15 isoform X1 [Acipenser oxyrinchus oxyrinchus]|uniref:TBC1 domain family member 15 isoform X1 n=1 Tax=Acipenser oxyrinchus oxyrinchus TaxID=40147 RepID=A0AAD8CNY3_ACIOX|nr:TBC1 domain family member 15 isoform X1 [Acipenser oxyrinchus oxyrinchus]
MERQSDAAADPQRKAMGSSQNEDEGSNRGAVPGSLRQPLLSPGSSGLQGVVDSEGRVDESRLRAYIFKQGGVLPGDRRLVWGFLFGMYPCSSTALERAALSEELGVRYQTMKRKWQRELPGAVRMRLNGTDEELIAAVKRFERRRLEAEESEAEESEEAREKKAFLQLQAQVLIDRVQLDIEELQEAVRIIDKDVPRTERDLDYFLGEGSANLLVLREVLITFAAFHPDVSYTQGMNELCSRFLEVLDSERDSYWCFSSYMEKIADDFKADGLRRKIELEVKLLQELDPELHAHLGREDLGSLTFCHRWLLLGFQREFEHSDALRLFEILSSNHLELNEIRDQERLRGGGEGRMELLPSVNPDFTFELFLCAAILLEHRATLLSCPSEVHLIQFTNSLQGKLDLNATLQKAEELFIKYCKKSVLDCFKNHCLQPKDREPFSFPLRSFFS